MLLQVNKGLPRQAEVAHGVPGRLRPRISWRFGTTSGRSSAIRTGRLYPRRNLWYSLSEAESTSGHMVLSGGGKKSPVKPQGIDPGTVSSSGKYIKNSKFCKFCQKFTVVTIVCFLDRYRFVFVGHCMYGQCERKFHKSTFVIY